MVFLPLLLRVFKSHYFQLNCGFETQVISLLKVFGPHSIKLVEAIGPHCIMLLKAFGPLLVKLAEAGTVVGDGNSTSVSLLNLGG